MQLLFFPVCMYIGVMYFYCQAIYFDLVGIFIQFMKPYSYFDLFAFKIQIFLQRGSKLLTQIVVGEHCYGTNVAPSSFLWFTCRRCRLHKFWWEDNEQAAAGGWLFGTLFILFKTMILHSIILFLRNYQFSLLILFQDDLNIKLLLPLFCNLIGSCCLSRFFILWYINICMVTCSFYSR